MQNRLIELVRQRGFRPRLLIVDDQAFNIRLVHGLFQDQFDMFMATNGAQAIALCETQHPDLVLLDVMMPGMDGHAVCQQLKAAPSTSEIPVIFLTAQRDEDNEAMGFEMGAVDFISKPINSIILQARVTTHLALKLQSDLLQSFAFQDGLTGVCNRRKFDEALTIFWRQALRKREAISLLMIDIDFFKTYNDYYGHQAGDECLRLVAQTIKRSFMRPCDVVARYGGEEFACILPETDGASALELAERVRAAVDALAIAHAASAVAPVVTISVGVATCQPCPGLDSDALLRDADQSLYAAKHAGRARVVMAGTGTA